jgi:iron complex outermembrane receptor protein
MYRYGCRIPDGNFPLAYKFPIRIRLKSHNMPFKARSGAGRVMRACRMVTSVILCGLLCATAAAVDLARVIEFHIAPQRLSGALVEFSHQANVQIIVGPEVGDRNSAGLHGRSSIAQGLTTLLNGSSLVYRVVNDTSITVGYSETSQNLPAAGALTRNTENVASDPGLERNSARELPTSDENSAFARSASALQEIIVTANRREESLSKVPISMTALTQSNMDALGIKDLADVARFTPGVSLIDQGNAVNITIRGIGSSAGAATTGIYIDDTPIQERALSISSQTLPKTFDLERVEVLRGPQGTLFGAGSEGGTVRYILAQPSLTAFSSYARSELSYTEGGSPSYEAGFAAGGPLVDDTLGFRASLWYRRDGGWTDLINPSTDATVRRNNNYGETIAARLAATWAPTSSVSITPSVMYQDRKLHDQETYWGILSNPRNNQFVSADPSRTPEDDSYGLGSLKITADFGKTQFISNTSGFHRQDIGGYDGTLYNLSYYQTLGWLPDSASGAPGSSPYVPFAGSACPTQAACYPFLDGSGVHLPPSLQSYRAQGIITQKQDVFTQEFRLQSSDPSAAIAWTVGVFYSIGRTTSFEQIQDPMVDQLFEGVFGTTLCNAFGQLCNANGSTYLPNGDSYFNYLTGHDRQLAGFGEAVWTLADRLKLTTGVRYSKIDFTSTTYANGPTNYGASYASGAEHEHPVTERVSLAFQADPKSLYYATFSTGFRPGGANSPIPPTVCAVDFLNFRINSAPESYHSDTVRSIEVGAKNNLAGRLKLATSAYYIKWNGIQQSVALPNCGLTYTSNLGTAASKGADLEADWAVVDAVTLETAIGYTNAKYTSSSFAGPGATIPLVAKGDSVVSGVGAFAQPPSPWTVSVGAQYDFSAYAHKSFARIDYEYGSKNNTPFAGEDPRTVQYDPYLGTTSSHRFVSARAGTGFGRVDVALFIDNLLDSHTITSISHTGLDGSGPQPPVSPLYTYTTFRPRTFGLTFIYRNKR